MLGRAAVAWAQESLPEDEQREFLDVMFDEQARSMYLNAFAAGGLAGSVGGGAVGEPGSARKKKTLAYESLFRLAGMRFVLLMSSAKGQRPKNIRNPRSGATTDRLYIWAICPWSCSHSSLRTA